MSEDVRIDQALELQAISIRLQRVVVEAFKALAVLEGVGYQPLMREALMQHANAEMLKILKGDVEELRRNEP